MNKCLPLKEDCALHHSNLDFWLARRKSIGPKPGFELIVPGHQDALMATARLAGAPTSLCLRRVPFFLDISMIRSLSRGFSCSFSTRRIKA